MSTELSLYDDRLLRSAYGRSAEELGEIVGTDPLKAVARVKYLIKQRDVYTMIEQEELLLFDMIAVKDRVMAALEAMNVNDNDILPKYIKLAIESLNSIGVRLDKRRSVLESKKSDVSDAQAEIFAEAYDAALDYTFTTLALRYGIPEEEVTELQENALRAAAEKMQEIRDRKEKAATDPKATKK